MVLYVSNLNIRIITFFHFKCGDVIAHLDHIVPGILLYTFYHKYTHFDDINTHFDDIDTLFDDINTHFDDINTHFDNINTHFDDVTYTLFENNTL